MKRPVIVALSLLTILSGMRVIAAGQTDLVLTNASAILALSGEQAAQAMRVSIRGVVTATEHDWGGRFYMQDSSGGVFVENISSNQPWPGDAITLTGVTFPGGYAPTISKPHWKIIGKSPLPAPKLVAVEELMSGAEDGQRIEISGIVRSAQTVGPLLEVELFCGGYRVPVFAPMPSGLDPQTLIGAQVRAEGTPATAYNAPLRHLIGVDVYVPFGGDFVVEKPAGPDAFGEPITPANNMAQYRASRTFADRVHVKGVLIYQRKGRDLFIQDATGGLQIRSRLPTSLSKGDVVEAVGFPDFDGYLPVLEDAVFKKTTDPRVSLTPIRPPIDDLLNGLHHSDLVTLRGKLLDRLEEQVALPTGESEIKTILVLQSSNRVFTAQAETSEPNQMLKSIPLGSVLEVSGVCFLQSAEDGRIQSFQILLPAAYDTRVLSRPGWFTAEHLLYSLSVALVVIFVGTSWTIMVTRRNSALKLLIYQRELDQKELQIAHDTLEERVKERTEQLKFQVTARKEAEVQFKATLAERTRLAKELHDTIEQTMTGITLQLNTVGKLFHEDPETAGRHLGLIRNMVRLSRVDLRRSIWDLRSRELEQFDLYKALSLGASRIASNAGIRVDVETKGIVCPLPEVIEEALLRIGQEAVTNTVKHADAHCIKIELDFGQDHIGLLIRDDGKGFMPESCPGPNDGHFGLLGMAERAKRLGGQITVTSAPGAGTVIRVEIPVPRPEAQQPINEQTDYEENVADSNTHR
ncbi:MAG TPA: histidine kinase [Alphaproteobacteria bacterium]|nr:histidine kinase [Alphaproteobacteria bacterium]